MKASRDGHIIEGGPISLMKAIYGWDREGLEFVYDYPRLDVAVVLYDVLDTLTVKQQSVIERRFGLDVEGAEPMTLAAIASEGIDTGLGYRVFVTRETVRQIEAKALRKLRHPTLRRYLDAHLVRRKEKDANRLGTTETSDD
jgi:hypothetical protein